MKKKIRNTVHALNDFHIDNAVPIVESYIVLAYLLTLMSVHQSAIYQLFFMDPALADANSEFNLFINEFIEKYGERHRTFGHGMVHGAEAGLFFGLAMLGITTLMQNKPFRLVWIHLGFWVLCCGLMGGVVCAFF